MIAVTAMTPASDTTADHALPTPVVVGCTRLHDWGVLWATGDDAAAFLHGQLTQDVLSLRDDEARLAAYCNPKGRMLMTGLALRAEGGVLVCTLRERIAPMLKRLSMFVLRAKVSHAFKDTYDSCSIMVFQDATHWAKSCFELTDFGTNAVVSVVTKGDSDDANGPNIDGDEVWLQMCRKDNAFAFHYSLDGEYFFMTRFFTLPAVGKTVKIGLLAQAPTG